MSPPVGRGGAGQEDASQDERLLFGCLSLLGIAQTSGVPLSKHMFRQSNRPALESVVFHLYALAKGKAQAKKDFKMCVFKDGESRDAFRPCVDKPQQKEFNEKTQDWLKELKSQGVLDLWASTTTSLLINPTGNRLVAFLNQLAHHVLWLELCKLCPGDEALTCLAQPPALDKACPNISAVSLAMLSMAHAKLRVLAQGALRVVADSAAFQDAAEATAAQLQEEHYRLVAQLQRLNGQAGSSSSSSLGAAAAVAGAASEPAAVDWDEVRQAAAAWAQLDAQAKRHAAELQPLLQQVAGSSVHPSPIDGSRLGPQKDVAVLVEGWLQQVQQVAAAASELAAAAGTSDSGGGQAAAAAAVFVGGGGDLTARSAVAALPAAQLLTGCGPHASHAQRLLAVHRSGASAVESAYAAVQQSVAEAQHEVQQLTQRLAAAGIMGPMAATSAAAGVGPFFASPAPTSALRQQPNGAASSSVLSPAPAPAAFSAPKFLSAAAAAGWSVAAGAPGGAQAAPLLSPELLQQKQLLQMRMRQLQLIGDDGDGGTAATASAVAAPQAGLEPASAASLVAEAPASPLAAKSPVLSAAKPKRLTYAGEARQQQAAAAAAGSAARRAPPTTGRRPLATAASSNGANGRQRSAPPGSPTLRITLRNLYTDLGGGRSAVAKAEDKENSPDEAAQPDGALPLTTKPPSVDSPAAAATSKLSASFSDLPHLPRVASPAATAPKPLQTGTSNRPAAPASALLASSGAGAAQLQALRSRFAALASRVAGN